MKNKNHTVFNFISLQQINYKQKLKWCIYNSHCFGLISKASNIPSEGSIKNGKAVVDGGLSLITWS